MEMQYAIAPLVRKMADLHDFRGLVSRFEANSQPWKRNYFFPELGNAPLSAIQIKRVNDRAT